MPQDDLTSAAIPGLRRRESAGRRRRGRRTRCTGVATTGRVCTVIRQVQPRQSAVRLVPEVALRPLCKNNHTVVRFLK